MKFYIDSKSYRMREEKEGCCLLMVQATNQTMTLNPSTRLLFRHLDAWVDLDAFVGGLEFGNVSRQRLFADYAAALYRLNVNGVARISDWPASTESGCRRARISDYHHLSAFCLRSRNAPFSVVQNLRDSYYSPYSTYARLGSRISCTVVVLQEGAIVACLLLSLSLRSFGGLAVNIESLMFREDLEERACGAMMKDMLSVARETFEGKATKLRYEAIHPRQERAVAWLTANGFYRSAVLPKELSSGQDLVLYDFDLPPLFTRET